MGSLGGWGLWARCWCPSRFVQLGWLVAVHGGLIGDVDVDWFGVYTSEACTCVVDG